MNHYIITNLAFSMRHGQWVKTESTRRGAIHVAASTPAGALALGKNKSISHFEGSGTAIAVDGTGYAIELA